MSEQGFPQPGSGVAGDAGGDVPPPMPQQQTSGWAIAALVMGIASLVTCGLASIPGVIVGVIALVKINNSQRRLGGRGLAIAGTVISGASVFLIAIVLNEAQFDRGYWHRYAARETKCKYNLYWIAEATQKWSLRFGDGGRFYPSELRALYVDGVISAPGQFLCPAKYFLEDSSPPVAKGRTSFVTDYECTLDLISGKVPTAEVADSVTPLAWDKPGNHADGVVVVYFDQRIDFIRGPNPYERIRREIEDSVDDELRKKIVWRGALAP